MPDVNADVDLNSRGEDRKNVLMYVLGFQVHMCRRLCPFLLDYKSHVIVVRGCDLAHLYRKMSFFTKLCWGMLLGR